MSLIDLSDKERRLADRVDTGVVDHLAVSDAAGGVAFNNAGQIMEFSKMMALANSGVRKHLRGNPGACLAICVQAVEWGMSPFAVANKSYFVNDQIAFESQLIQAVILKRAPIKGRIHFEFSGSGQARQCRAWARLKDEDEVVDYLSPEFKDITPKNSPLWKADPDQQMCYSAGRALCRRHFPDVLLGVYSDDELPQQPAGPDRARDVTPPRTMIGKLDALAAQPDRKERPTTAQVDSGQNVDTETGEVTDNGGQIEDNSDGASPDDASAAIDESEPLSPRDQVLDELRAAVMDRKKLTPLLNALGDRRPLVTDDDVKSLREMEKALGQKEPV